MDNAEQKSQELINKNIRNINDTSWKIIAVAENLQNGQTFMMAAEDLLQIQFRNSIQLPVPQLTILYRDNNFNFSYFLRINGLKLHIMITAERFSKQLQPIDYVGEFILSDFEVKQKNKNFNIYSLFFKQIDILKLLQNVNYSTNKQTLSGQISPYKIISDINKIIQNSFDNKYVETTRRIDFISSQNSSALQIIKYCLKMRN